MKITVDDDLIYIYLQSKERLPLCGTITNVNGYLLYDCNMNWLGVRVMRTAYREKPQSCELPSAQILDFPLQGGSVREYPNYIEIKFNDKVEVDKTFEQECHVDITADGMYGIEIIRYMSNPRGKKTWVFPFIDHVVFEDDFDDEQEGYEGFYIDKDGKKTDIGFHDHDIDDDTDRRWREEINKISRTLSEEEMMCAREKYK
jgi:hypothetical protein